MAYTFVNTVEAMGTFLSDIANLPSKSPALYLDLEGANLSREGTLSLISVFVQPLNHAYIVDVTTLKEKTFSTEVASVSTSTGKHEVTVKNSIDPSNAEAKSTLASSVHLDESQPGKQSAATAVTFKTILESPSITKVFFDVRNDSDALFSHYGIRLAGIEDVQLQELAARPRHRNKTFLCGLAKCVDLDLTLPAAEKTEWLRVKNKGVRLFGPEYGGSYAVFDARPLAEDIVRYCVNDVRYLPLLRENYLRRLDARWKAEVLKESKRRVLESQSAEYRPGGREKAISPWANGVRRTTSLLAGLSF